MHGRTIQVLHYMTWHDLELRSVCSRLIFLPLFKRAGASTAANVQNVGQYPLYACKTVPPLGHSHYGCCHLDPRPVSRRAAAPPSRYDEKMMKVK
jgi:hypothetical protein